MGSRVLEVHFSARRLGALLGVAMMTFVGVAYADGEVPEAAATPAEVSRSAARGAGGGLDGRKRDRSGRPQETVEAEVTLLRRAGGSEGNPSGAPVITVRTASGEELILHVGPPFLRKEKEFPIALGDKLVATGWREPRDGYQLIAVRTVKNGDKTLEVRDETGKRLWKRPDPADDGSPFDSITGEIIGFGMKAHEPGNSTPDDGENGVVLIRAAEGDIYGHIGPAVFRQAAGLRLALGDQLTLRAWRIDARMSNRPFVIVRSVVSGGVDVELRTDRRKPLWKPDKKK